MQAKVSPVATFAVATLIPVPLLFGAALWGGIWVIAACLYLTLFVFTLDELTQYAAQDAPPGVEFPAASWLSHFLGVIHFPVLFLGVAAASGATDLAGLERVGTLVAFGLFMGQVLYSNAHELIHRPTKLAFWLGTLVYSSALYGHHVTAHRFIHHRFVGSSQDPNTARLGQGFWRFSLQAWTGAFWAGLEVEMTRSSKKKGLLAPLRNIYFAYIAIGLGTCWAVFASFGTSGLAAFIVLTFYAGTQILLADYVQHYGLRRRTLPNGKLEPIGIEHSWNAPHPVSAALMLNAPRHSDHHVNPTKPFPSLELPEAHEAPMLPASLPAMSVLALFPPLWRRVMDPRARAWRESGSFPHVPAE